MRQLPWGQVVKHAAARIEECRDALERADTERVHVLQARIAVWREVIELPDTAKSHEELSEKAAYN